MELSELPVPRPVNLKESTIELSRSMSRKFTSDGRIRSYRSLRATTGLHCLYCPQIGNPISGQFYLGR